MNNYEDMHEALAQLDQIPKDLHRLYKNLYRAAHVVVTTNYLHKEKVAWYEDLAKVVNDIDVFQKKKGDKRSVR